MVSSGEMRLTETTLRVFSTRPMPSSINSKRIRRRTRSQHSIAIPSRCMEVMPASPPMQQFLSTKVDSPGKHPSATTTSSFQVYVARALAKNIICSLDSTSSRVTPTSNLAASTSLIPRPTFFSSCWVILAVRKTATAGRVLASNALSAPAASAATTTIPNSS